MIPKVEKQYKIFSEVFENLNQEQKRAVTELAKPVMVIAGPGTGKTQILAARIAYMLLHSDNISHENILCLTYTDAGAIAMRKRLLQFIGPDAYRISIYTFHAFCNAVIQENLNYFGKRDLEAVSELEQIEIVHEIIDSFTSDNPLKRYSGDYYFEAPRLLNLYEWMKKENVDSKQMHQYITEYLNEIELSDKYIYKKGDKKGEKKPDYFKIVDKMKLLQAAVDTFDTYVGKLKDRGRYDFHDMLIWVIEAFQNNEMILRDYQEKYQSILVDEYQDTNGAQNKILEMLISYWEIPDVFVVGDDDQSIFRFQGANVANINEFVSKYENKDLEQITLKLNYRSEQSILDAADALIKHNQQRLDQEKKIISAREPFHTFPLIQYYPNFSSETAMIGKEVKTLLDSGVPGNEIAIIYRKHAQAEELIRFFNYLKIPVKAKKEINILEQVLIQNLIHFLRFIHAEHSHPGSGDAYLFECLHYPGFGIAPLDLTRIAIQMQKGQKYREQWREVITENFQKTHPEWSLNFETQAALFRASQIIEKWIKCVVEEPIQELVSRVIRESNMLDRVLQSEHRNEQLQWLHTFYDFVKDSVLRQPGIKLAALLELIDRMNAQGVSIGSHRIWADVNGVQFLTGYASKGLEFDHVFMIGCNQKNWDKSNRNSGYTLPETIAEKVDETEDFRRLFYVAMTRARKGLILTYSEANDDAKELEKSRFIAEVEASGVKAIRANVDATFLQTFETSLFYEPSSAVKHYFENEWINELLENYQLSVTHLSAYLRCATSFYFEQLLQVPAPMSNAAAFGVAIHKSLESLFRNMMESSNQTFPTIEFLVKEFKREMYRLKDLFNEKEFEIRLESGEKILPEYYEARINGWIKDVQVEKLYHHKAYKHIPIKGKIDKIEFLDHQVNVVDYKTGKYKKEAFKAPILNQETLTDEELNQLSFEDRYGGNYWRQAAFYALLLSKSDDTTKDLNHICFDYVERDKTSKEIPRINVQITKEDLDMLGKQMEEVYDAIQHKKFSDGCKEPDCVWCNFMQTVYPE